MWVIILIILFGIFSTENSSAELTLLYPLSNDSLECGSAINIKWKNTSKDPIDLYYSLDSNNWQIIAKNLTIDNYNWTIPNSIKSKIYFKLQSKTIGGIELIWDNQNAHSNWVKVAKFVNNDKVVTVGRDDSVKVWDIPSKKLLRTLFIQNSPTNIQATNFAIEYDKNKLLVAQDKAIWTWDLNTDIKKRIYVNPKLDEILTLDYDPNNREVAVSSKHGIVTIIDLFGKATASFNLISDPLFPINTIYSLDYSADGKFLLAAGDDGYLHLINLETEEIKKSKYHHGITNDYTIWSAQISNDNRLIISGGVDNIAIIWDFNTLDTIKTINYNADIRAAKFNNRSDKILIAGLANTLEQYTINQFKISNTTIDHKAQILWAEYLNNGDTLITAGRDNSFKIWRNIGYQDNEFVSSSILYQKLKINFPKLYVNINQKFNIPIEFEGDFKFLDSINIEYSLPIDIIKLNNISTPIKSVAKDEIFSKTFIKDSIKTQVLYNATALLSNRKNGDILFSNIKFYPEGNYKIETNDGFIEIIDSCNIDSSRYVTIDKANTNVVIANQIVSNVLKYKLNTIIDAKFDIAIYNYNGIKILSLNNSFYRNGIYDFSKDISSLPNNIYFLVTKYEDNILCSQFIKYE